MYRKVLDGIFKIVLEMYPPTTYLLLLFLKTKYLNFWFLEKMVGFDLDCRPVTLQYLTSQVNTKKRKIVKLKKKKFRYEKSAKYVFFNPGTFFFLVIMKDTLDN